MAGAKVAIVNGIGYDSWASQLLAANPVGGRVVVDAGDVLGLKEGDNPHQWYSPASVRQVIDAIVAAYVEARPGRRRLLRRAAAGILETKGFAALRPTARARSDAGSRACRSATARASSSRSATSLGLKLLTPPSFAKAIAEGSEVSAADRQTVERQLQKRLDQGVGLQQPERDARGRAAQRDRAGEARSRSRRSPRRSRPRTSSFEQWQVAELEGLVAALHRATGR